MQYTSKNISVLHTVLHIIVVMERQHRRLRNDFGTVGKTIKFWYVGQLENAGTAGDYTALLYPKLHVHH